MLFPLNSSMKFSFLRLVLAAVVSVLASCATTSYYQGSPVNGSSNAVIRNFYRSGGEQGIHQNFVVVRVDDLQVFSRWRSPGKNGIPLAPGPHRIQLYAESYSSLLSVPYEAWIEIPFTARAGRSYRPKGYVDGMNVIVWIEDEGSGKEVIGRKTVPLHVTTGYGPLRPPPLENP